MYGHYLTLKEGIDSKIHLDLCLQFSTIPLHMMNYFIRVYGVSKRISPALTCKQNIRYKYI